MGPPFQNSRGCFNKYDVFSNCATDHYPMLFFHVKNSPFNPTRLLKQPPGSAPEMSANFLEIVMFTQSVKIFIELCLGNEVILPEQKILSHFRSYNNLPDYHLSHQLTLVNFFFEFECLFNATLTAEVISWRGRPDNVVAVRLDPKNSSSAGGALNHCATGAPLGESL